MTEPPPRNGRDFAIGFFGSILLTVPSMMLLLTEIIGPALAPAILAVLVLGAVIAFIRKRKFIGIGILIGITAIPFLFVGSCFAVMPWL